MEMGLPYEMGQLVRYCVKLTSVHSVKQEGCLSLETMMFCFYNIVNKVTCLLHDTKTRQRYSYSPSLKGQCVSMEAVQCHNISLPVKSLHHHNHALFYCKYNGNGSLVPPPLYKALHYNPGF